MLNLPFEPYGLSNDVFVTFGVPDFIIKLAALTLVLVLPMIVCMPLSAWLGPWVRSPTLLARVGLTLLLLMTSSVYLLDPSGAMLMFPDWFPWRFGVIIGTGVLEAALAVLLWVPGWTRRTGIAIVILLIVVLPADIYGAWNAGMYSGNVLGPAYLLARVPLQIMLIAWTLWATSAREVPRVSVAPGRKREPRAWRAPS